MNTYRSRFKKHNRPPPRLPVPLRHPQLPRARTTYEYGSCAPRNLSRYLLPIWTLISYLDPWSRDAFLPAASSGYTDISSYACAIHTYGIYLDTGK